MKSTKETTRKIKTKDSNLAEQVATPFSIK